MASNAPQFHSYRTVQAEAKPAGNSRSEVKPPFVDRKKSTLGMQRDAHGMSRNFANELVKMLRD